MKEREMGKQRKVKQKNTLLEGWSNERGMGKDEDGGKMEGNMKGRKGRKE